MNFIFLSLALLALTSCAKLEGEETFETSERLIASMETFANISSGTTVWCYVSFKDPDNPSQLYELEEGSVVACNGQIMTRNLHYYYAYVDRGTATGPVMLSVTRPKAGTSFVHWFDLQ